MSQPDRRALLRFLATSPLLAGLPLSTLLAQERALAAATEALDVFDLEAAAKRVVPPAHWGYLQSGVDGETTLRANQSAYSRWQLKPRRFVDVSRMDLSVTLFGTKYATPVLCSPIGSLRALHADGELGVARAAKAKNAVQMMSTVASYSVEDITRERSAPVWFQLYTTNRIEATRVLVKRAEAAGCPVVAVTVDLPAGRNTVTASRLRRDDTPECAR
jgi:4-hydroxymandelate oxidase